MIVGQKSISTLQLFPMTGGDAYKATVEHLEKQLNEIPEILRLLRMPEIREAYINSWSPTALINEFIIECEG